MTLADGFVDDRMLDELDELVASATGGKSGKWFHNANGRAGEITLGPSDVIPFLVSEWTIRSSAVADSELIVALKNNALRLTAAIRHLRAVRAEARNYVGSAGSPLRAAIDKGDGR